MPSCNAAGGGIVRNYGKTHRIHHSKPDLRRQQQPWNVRLTTQAEEQVNCHSSVTDFLRRRPATRHIAKALSSKPPSGVAMHTINRDEQEQYIVLASATGFNVFDLGGNPKTVNADEDALAYLEGVTDPGKDLRFLTINDYTFVLNRKKTVKALDESSLSGHTRRWSSSNRPATTPPTPSPSTHPAQLHDP